MRSVVIKSFCWTSLGTVLFFANLPLSGAEREAVGEPASQEWTSPNGTVRILPKLNNSSVEYDHGAPTDHEQYMLELMNRARAHPVAEAARLGIDLNEDLPPGTISTNAKPPLASHPQLLAAARGHNVWMLDANVFSHTGVNGSSPGDRMIAEGYSFVYPGGWGENIAWRGTTASSFNLTYYVELLHDGLFRSEGHRENLMRSSYDEVGVGVNTGYFFRDGTDWNSAMATHNFARTASTPGPLVVGVVYRDANGNGAYDPGEGEAGVTVMPESGGYHAVTSSSGGYAFPFSGSGDLDVEFSGGSLTQPVTRRLERGSVNVKLDLELNSAKPLAFASSVMSGPGDHPQISFSGPADLQINLERSTDFLNWTVLATYILGPDPVVFVDTNAPSQAATYRLVAP